MPKTITFNELRRIKDNLPSGTMHEIAKRLDLNVETVRNYFGGANYETGESAGLIVEQGPDGGIVSIEDTTILEMAEEILQNQE
jgi:hypothetical protein